MKFKNVYDLVRKIGGNKKLIADIKKTVKEFNRNDRDKLKK